MARSHDDRPTDAPKPADRSNPPGAGAPSPGALTADEQGRLRELRAKPEAERSPDEKTELAGLEARNVPQPAAVTDRIQRDLSPDRAPAPLVDMPKDDANRLRDLRVANELGRLSDGERAEMGTLSMAESEAAGHVMSPDSPETEDDGSWVIDELLGMIEAMVDLTPAYRNIGLRVRTMRARLEEARHPTPGDEAEAADRRAASARTR